MATDPWKQTTPNAIRRWIRRTRRIIAINAFKEHTNKKAIKAQVGYYFIEEDKKRAEHLESLLARMRPGLPYNCTVHPVILGSFDETMTTVLDNLEEQRKRIAPCLVMIDPFGVSGTPMRVTRRILQNRSCEIYSSFMYESINRFKTRPEFERHLDDLFGCRDWRYGVGVEEPEERSGALLRRVTFSFAALTQGS